MSKLLLSHWESVELFCRVISKYEKKDLSTFSDIDMLKSFLDKAEHTHYCDLVTQRINKDKKSEDKMGAKVFPTLSRCVRCREPFMTSDETIGKLREFICDPSYAIRYSTIEKWQPTQKKMQYEDTNWNLYSYDIVWKIESGKLIKIPVINKGVLRFRRFGKVEIDNYNIKSDLQEKYIGEFHMYGNKDYLILKLKTDDDQKYLRFEFYIGPDKVVSLALGQYHNIADSIYSGTALIVHETDEAKLTTGIFDGSIEDQKKDIPEHFWHYFANKKFNTLRTPGHINTPHELIEWMQSKADKLKSTE